MSALTGQLVEGIRSTFEFLRSTREAYEGAGRFAKMRIWILVALVLDLAATVTFASMVGSRAIDVEVWFEPSFPSNMLIVRNESGDELEGVKLTLDGRWQLDVGAIAPGLRGFEVNREFRDATGNAPDDSYRPQHLEILADGNTMIVPVSGRP